MTRKSLEGKITFGIECLDGVREKGTVYGVGAWNIGDIEGTKAVEETYEMGKNV